MTCEDINITIIGGTRGLGLWFANQLKLDGFNITITSRNKTSGQKVAQKIDTNYSNDNITAIQNADIILFAVPIEAMEETIKNVAPHANRGSLLIDITSVKSMPSEALIKFAPADCEILPSHPMFGPRIPSLDDQIVILTPIENRCEKWFNKVYSFLEDHGAKIVISTPEEHDKTMSVVQGLTHFSYISIASTIERLQVSVKKSREFASPVYSLMLDMISRIVSQNPYLYYSIQKNNPQTAISRRTLIEESKKLAKLIEESKEAEFVENMSNSAKYLDEYEEALGRSDKAINALNQDFYIIKSSIGNEMGFKHQYSENIHVGIVKSIKNDIITIINVHKKEVELKLSNVVILTDEEVFEWKKNNLPVYTYDVSVLLPTTCDESVLLDMFSNIDQVISVELIDTYISPKFSQGLCSYTFRYSTFEKKNQELVENYLKGIGGVIH
ncbi:MAG: prephenate dehydrogenase [Methanosphaera sp.]|nr:prephenate dehydrogenase [Methanosphaera sp.]